MRVTIGKALLTLDRFLKKIKRAKPNGKNGLNINPVHLAIGIAFVLTLLISFMLPVGRSLKFTDLKEGEVYVGDEIIAPFTFPINKTDEEYKKDLEKAEEEVLPVFVRNDSLQTLQLERLQAFFDSLKSILSIEKKSDKAQQLRLLFSEYKINASEEIISLFLHQISKDSLTLLEDALVKVLRDINSVGILSDSPGLEKSKTGKISVLTDVEEIISPVSDFYELSEVGNLILEKLRSLFPDDEIYVKAGYEIIRVFIKPTIFYNEAETQKRIEEARRNVPLAKGTVLANERIIDRYERVTKDHIAKLNSLAIELAEREKTKHGILNVFHFFGRFFLVFLAICIFAIFLFFTQRNVIYDTNKIILLALIFFIVCLISFYINKFNLSPYLMPVTLGSMLLAIFFGMRIGFMGTVVLSILIGSLRGNEFNITFISIFAGVIAALSVSRIRKRNWLVNSIAMVVGAYIISITIVEILHYTPWKQIFRYWGYGTINGFFSTIFAYGLQVLFEFTFDLVTDMKLLELSDLNNPLLRKMSIQAPGTYHHSLMVGNLAGAAAEAIGANALLARVGAYYHDIGKIEKPEYFIENQLRNRNPHEKLSPSMSCLILSNHVRRGLELAKEYKLPREIRDFISEHHGTSRMEYFYQKALEKNGEEEIEESNFRYPGPRPKTKETGIVMLADAVEATSRTLKDPSVSRIRGMVISIVQSRFKASELNDSPLTLRDLNKIMESFETVLLGTFHSRIEYPEQEEKGASLKEKATND